MRRRRLAAYRDHPDDQIECINGICIYYRGRYLTGLDITRFKIKIDDTKIEELIAKEDCMFSAGGLIVEDLEVPWMNGTQESIEGLPVHAIVKLAEFIVKEKRIKACLFDMDG
jgi:predicted house-cleaning NTP pyrophosphatase (Maf/HAM1 superfamily)